MSTKTLTQEQWTDLAHRISPNKVFYGTCATDAATAAKVVECPQFKTADLVAGVRISITMTNAQTFDGQVTLNVNNTGAQNFTVFQDETNGKDAWEAGMTIDCVYDGLAWVLVGPSLGGVNALLMRLDTGAGV